jgi:hypothetical protein
MKLKIAWIYTHDGWIFRSKERVEFIAEQGRTRKA